LIVVNLLRNYVVNLLRNYLVNFNRAGWSVYSAKRWSISPFSPDLYLIQDFKPNITCLKSEKLLVGTFKPRIYYYTIDVVDKAAWEKINNLTISSNLDTLTYLGFDYNVYYNDMSDEGNNSEKGVCVTLPANIKIIEACYSFVDVGFFKFNIKDITDNILFHDDVPQIYLSQFNNEDSFYQAVNGVIEGLVDIDSIIQKMNHKGELFLLPCERKLLDSLK
jgi:hypothetical protein